MSAISSTQYPFAKLFVLCTSFLTVTEYFRNLTTFMHAYKLCYFNTYLPTLPPTNIPIYLLPIYLPTLYQCTYLYTYLPPYLPPTNMPTYPPPINIPTPHQHTQLPSPLPTYLILKRTCPSGKIRTYKLGTKTRCILPSRSFLNKIIYKFSYLYERY